MKIIDSKGDNIPLSIMRFKIGFLPKQLLAAASSAKVELSPAYKTKGVKYKLEFMIDPQNIVE